MWNYFRDVNRSRDITDYLKMEINITWKNHFCYSRKIKFDETWFINDQDISALFLCTSINYIIVIIAYTISAFNLIRYKLLR